MLSLACAALAACHSTNAAAIPDTQSRYDVLPRAALLRLGVARSELEHGRVASAITTLDQLARLYPENLYVGQWRQEAEIAALAPGADLASGPSAGSAGGASQDPGLDRLRQAARALAEAEPSAVHFVLAARLEPDPLAARLLLDQAALLAPDCAWVPYARAFLAARASEWNAVPELLEQARMQDPGQLLVAWLSAWSLARGGSPDAAAAALVVWIEKVHDDPRIDARWVRGAQLDLALLALSADEPRRSRRTLAEVGASDLDPMRRLCAEACAEEALGHPRAAFNAAQEAERRAPSALLPVVQQALLQQYWLNEPEAAETTWQRVLALARASPELGSSLDRLRASVQLERSRRARANSSTPPAGSSTTPNGVK